VITTKLTDRIVQLTRVLCLPEGASFSSRALLLGAILAVLGALTACGDAHLPLLTSIQVSPPTSTIDIGQTQQFTAAGTFSDGSTKDLTSLVTWSSSSATVAAISSSGLALSRSQGSSIISATFNTADGLVTGATTLNVVVTLKSLTITPVNSSIANGTSLQLTAAGVFSDGSTHDLTASVTWTSSSAAIATVSSGGVVTAMGVGSATITATQAGVSASTTVTVTPATLTGITITPPNSAIASGTSKQLIATGDFSDGTTQNLTAFVTWTSSNPSVAAVSNTAGSQGLVTGSGAGGARITATYSGVSGSTLMVVTSATLTGITITPPNSGIASGTSKQLTATGDFSDGTTQNLTALVTWTSSDPSLAAVSNAVGSRGLVTGTGVGNATITATLDGVSGSTGVTTTPPILTSIDIAPPNFSLAKGTSLQLTAIGNFSDGSAEDLTTSVTWTSSAPAIAVVSNAAGNQGLVTGTLVGSATVTAMQAGVSGSTTAMVTPAILTSIVVTPATVSIALGTTGQLTATGIFSDGTTEDLTASASWISTSDAIATVGNTGNPGLVTGTGVGSATITATQAGVSGSATVTITPAVLTSIVVTPAVPSIAKGTTVQLTATGTFSDGTTQDLTLSASWTTAPAGLATVDPNGLVTGTGVGSVSVTATQGAVSGSGTVTITSAVLKSITITPPNPSIAQGTSVQLTATGVFSDGSTQNLKDTVSWTSSAVAMVTVDPNGLATGTAVGGATVTANQGGVSGAATVTVTPAVLISIAVTPLNFSIAAGTQEQLVATGTFSDGTTQDLTHSVNWTSAPAGFATVDPNGLVTGTAMGGTTVTANQGGVSGATTVTVTPAVLISIAVTPLNFSIAAGTQEQLVATGTFSDKTIQNLTASASWISSSPAVATVDSPGGLVTGIVAGTATIQATQDGVTGSATVTVTTPEFAYVTDDTNNTVSAFEVNSSTGVLTAIAGSPFLNPGRASVAVTADPSGRFLYTTNDSSDNVTAYNIVQSGANSGALNLIGPVVTGGSGPFGIAVEPSGHFAYVGNEGSNTVSGFAIDASTGALTPISGSPFSTSPAMTPFGVAVHPNDHFIYVAYFVSSQVRLYTFNPMTGALDLPGTPSPPPAPSLPVSVTLDPMGRFAYTANLGGASVSVYTVDPGTGALTFVQNIPVGVGPLGGSPGLVAVDPSGRFAYVAGGGGVAGYSINQTTGALTPVAGSPFSAGSNPLWVTVNPNGRFVYVANHGVVGVTPGGVSAYTIDLATGALTPVTGSPFSLPGGASSITVVAVP
jgi:6-phosphogluconolactonase (cycloisomerase 2 family)/uncharacterized protein YjdB